MSSDLGAKQNYLCTEILDKGYNGEEFADFLGSISDAGTDLDAWTLSDLKKAVSRFILEKNPSPSQGNGAKPKQEQGSDDEDDRKPPITPMRIDFEEEDKKQRATQLLLNQSKEAISEMSKFFATTTTKNLLKRNALVDEPRLRIKVADPEIINKGLFSKKYAVYKVTTHPLNYEVKRRFNDFQWLRDMLVRDFPHIYVPPMTDKTRGNFELDFLNQRAKLLQQFMENLMESPELRSSLHVLCFLKSADEEQWNKIKAELEKVNKKIAVEIADNSRT